MDAVATVTRIGITQGALLLLASTLQLTQFMWPPQADIHEDCRYDYIVVGAGTAGSILANRLTENPHVNVLLLEAGGDPPVESVLPSLFTFLKNSQYDWNITAEFDSYSQANIKQGRSPLTRGRMLGGSSSSNYMFYVRGIPQDFNAWADVTRDPSWSWENVLPYFKKSERLVDPVVMHSPQGVYHGQNGYMGISRCTAEPVQDYMEAFEELGHDIIPDINGDIALGVTPPMLTLADGVRQSTAQSFLAPIRDRPNLHVIKNTLVTKIIFDNNKNAIGVDAVTNDGEKLTYRAHKEVIVSAGAFSSAQLLMLSGVGPRKQLQDLKIDVLVDSPGVGENLQDHTPVLMWHKLDRSDEPPPPANPHKFPFNSFSTYVALDRTQDIPDYQSISFVIPAGSPAVLELCAFTFDVNNDLCQSIHDEVRGRNVMFTFISHLRPKSKGKVVLRNADPAAAPLIYTRSFTNDYDLEHSAGSAEDFNKIVDTTFFRHLGAEMVNVKLPQCKGLKPGSREFWRCYALNISVTMFHYSGTCAMGTVVDSRLRVKGVKRLRVVDASIMPAITSSNTMAPVMMIAEKGADMIKHDGYEHHEHAYW